MLPPAPEFSRVHGVVTALIVPKGPILYHVEISMNHELDRPWARQFCGADGMALPPQLWHSCHNCRLSPLAFKLHLIDLRARQMVCFIPCSQFVFIEIEKIRLVGVHSVVVHFIVP